MCSIYHRGILKIIVLVQKFVIATSIICFTTAYNILREHMLDSETPDKKANDSTRSSKNTYEMQQNSENNDNDDNYNE